MSYPMAQFHLLSSGDACVSSQLLQRYESGEVDVWCQSFDSLVASHSVNDLRETLTEKELAKADRLVTTELQLRALAARTFLRRTLSAYLQKPAESIQFVVCSNGKPQLAESEQSELVFNLSHTSKMVVCSVTRQGQLGVDIECARDNIDLLKLAARFFSQQESEWLEHADEVDRKRLFLKMWTLKEAYVKASGEGLRLPLDQIILCENGVQLQLDSESSGSVNHQDWHFAGTELQGHALSVALCREQSAPLVANLLLQPS